MSTKGPSGYVTNVLAPELATLLIRDDMRVTIERAREILQESIAVGEELNGKEGEDSKTYRKQGRWEVDENGNEIHD
jgi:hypothetical protein